MKTKQSTRDKILDAVFKLVYAYGYNGTSTAMILKECNIPKGSMYHYFPSKKEMVLAVVKERLAPLMDEFFGLKMPDGGNGIDAIIKNILNISENEKLVSYGCPLNRLNQEMSPLDEEFEAEINIIYVKLRDKIKNLLKTCELQDKTDIDSLAEFIIASVWGGLSLSPKQSSKERFLQSINHLTSYLQSLKN